MKWKKWLPLLLAALWTGVLLTGCGKKEEPLEDGEQAYQVSYLDPGATQMLSREYRTKTRDVAGLVLELMTQLQRVPEELDGQTSLPEKVVYQGCRQEDMVLYVYFDSGYAGMEPQQEILCRAALTRTLTQIEGIDYIFIYAGDQPLTDHSGMPVGALSAADFVDRFSDVNAYERTELTLYFTDDAGEKLYSERRSVVHNVSTSVERVILDELIRGPERPGLAPTLAPDTRILNVSVNENVCYLNFDGSFLSNGLEVKDYIPIYSVVNSLSELSSVSRVQISVNGSQDVLFRDTVPLNTPFERNLDYVDTGEQPVTVLPEEGPGD